LVVTGLDTLNGVVNSEYSSLHSHKQYKKIFTSLSFIAFWISVISIVIVGLSILLKFPLINILFPGFDDYKKLTAVNLFSIILYIIFFKSISGFLITTSNSLKSFYIPAIIPVFLSVSIFAFSFLKSDDLIRNLAYGNLAGNIIIFIFLGLSFYKYREYFSFPSFKMDDVSKKIIFGCAATFLLVFSNQLFILSRNFFASYFDNGDLSSLNYATQITRLINLVIFLTVFNLSVNKFSSNYALTKIVFSRDFLIKLLFGISFIVLPIIVFFLSFSNEIISLVYKRGNITTTDINKIVPPFFWETLAILPYIFHTIITTLFLAFKKYKQLTKVGVLAFILGILFTYIFSSVWGYVGISMAQFATSLFYAITLTYSSQYLIGRIRKEIYDFVLIFSFGILIYFVFIFTKNIFVIDFNQGALIFKIVYLIISLILIYAVFLLLAFIFKIKFLTELINKIKLKKS